MIYLIIAAIGAGAFVLGWTTGYFAGREDGCRQGFQDGWAKGFSDCSDSVKANKAEAQMEVVK